MDALTSQHGGVDKWTELVEKAEQLWSLLSMLCDRYQDMFKTIKEAPEHPGVSYVVANERMRIHKLLDSIVTNNQSLNNEEVCPFQYQSKWQIV